MPETREVALDAETMHVLEREAARRGRSVADYMRELAARGGSRAVGPSAPRNGGGYQDDDPILRRYERAMEIRDRASLSRLLDPGSATPQPAPQASAKEIAAELATVLRPTQTGMGGLMDSFKPLIEMEAAMAFLERMGQRGGKGWSELIEPMTKRFEDQMKAQMSEITGLKSVVAKKDEEAKEAKLDQKLQAMMQMVEGQREFIDARLAELGPRRGHSGSDEEESELERAISSLERAKKAVDRWNVLFTKPAPAPGAEADIWQKGKYLLEEITNGVAKGMEAYGSMVAAAKTGVPPKAQARVLSQRPPPRPNYASSPAPPPASDPGEPAAPEAPAVVISPDDIGDPSPTTRAAQPGPSPAAPSGGDFDINELPPDVRSAVESAPQYVDAESGTVVDRQTWLNKYGALIKEHPEAIQTVDVESEGRRDGPEEPTGE